MTFRESALAHKWLDGLDGIEVGASAHNPFGIAGCRNVDYTDDPDTIFKDEERAMCGRACPVDVVDEGDTLATFPASSLGYVLSSHVFEHFPNPLGALLSWARVLRDGGLIYMVVPHRDALEADARLPLTTWEHVLHDLMTNQTVHTHPLDPGHGFRGHYHRYTLRTLIRFVEGLNLIVTPDVGFEVVDSEERDSKVGNGLTLVLRVNKCTSPRG